MEPLGFRPDSDEDPGFPLFVVCLHLAQGVAYASRGDLKKGGPKIKRPEQRSTFMPDRLGLGLLIRWRCSLGVLIVHYMILNYPQKRGIFWAFRFPIGAVLCLLLACSITVS